jgi:hypothetical protein
MTAITPMIQRAAEDRNILIIPSLVFYRSVALKSHYSDSCHLPNLFSMRPSSAAQRRLEFSRGFMAFEN